MSLPAILGVSLLYGIALGSVYFVALWATVRRIARQRRAGTWIAASLAIRLALVLVSFALAVRWGGWPALVAVLAGFVAARSLLAHRLRADVVEAESSP
jgi:F1F0 ATPase subunit 2